MKKLLLLSLILIPKLLGAQVLEVPTLKSKNIFGKATRLEMSQFEFVKDKGLTLTQTDIETYDEQSRLISIDRTVHTSGLKYLYTYKLSKKGRLEQEKITNAANNQTVRITDYAYKKGVLFSTTQVQGTVTNVKTYAHNKKGALTGLKLKENGTLKGEEFYQVDDKGRKTQTSQKIGDAKEAVIISAFTYVEQDSNEVKTEIRNVNGVKYEIVSIKDLATERSIKETTKNLSNAQSGFSDFLYKNDERGSWTKAEIIDNQFGRSRLILRKITYADGVVTGRTEFNSEDDRARYYRQYQQYQLLYNGKEISGGGAVNLPDTDDRLVYVSEKQASILLKGYDKESRHTTWHEAQIVSHLSGDVFWSPKGDDVNLYHKGKQLARSTYSTANPYAIYKVDNNAIIHVFKDVKKGFEIASFDSEDYKGRLQKAELKENPYVWTKVSDTTFVLIGYGSTIGLKNQLEDDKGNKLVNTRSGNFWYALPNFRKNFNEGTPGEAFSAFYLKNPKEDLKERSLFDADFSGFKYDKLIDNQYRLKTVDGQVVTNLTIANSRTSDEQLITYFPMIKEYLRMEEYYTLPQDKESNDQSVTVLLQGFEDVFYIYGGGKSIEFYQSGKKVGVHNFAAHKLVEETSQYGAVLYDSASRNSYGMRYDIANGDGIGSMERLSYNSNNAYLLKLATGNWIVFEQGVKVTDYSYSKVSNGIAYHFFKDQKSGEVLGYKFRGYGEAKAGEFVDAVLLTNKQSLEMARSLNIDPSKIIEEVPSEN